MSETDIIDYTELNGKPKTKLSVPLITMYLSKHFLPVEIARACNVTRGAVSDYIKRHYEELKPQLDKDEYIACKFKQLVDKGIDVLVDVLDEPMTKKDIIPLNAMIGTAADKYRLYMGKSTSNNETHHKFIIDHISQDNWSKPQDIVSPPISVNNESVDNGK